MPDYPNITTGLGRLTPQLWTRLMKMLRSYESTYPRDERHVKSSVPTTFFLAKIRNATCIDVNRYKYSWIQVYLKDDNTIAELTNGLSSTGDNDEWDFAAINLLEISNTSSLASAGVDMTLGDYPNGYNLQLIGGGYTTTGQSVAPAADAIVHLTKIKGSSVQTEARYVFSNVNEHDGEC